MFTFWQQHRNSKLLAKQYKTFMQFSNYISSWLFLLIRYNTAKRSIKKFLAKLFEISCKILSWDISWQCPAGTTGHFQALRLHLFYTPMVLPLLFSLHSPYKCVFAALDSHILQAFNVACSFDCRAVLPKPTCYVLGWNSDLLSKRSELGASHHTHPHR